MRKTIFANDEYYHIYNRGVDKRDVFLDENDYERFLLCLLEFNRPDPIGSLYEKSFRDKNLEAKPPIGGLASSNEALVEIIAYCLNPNHFHLVLKQVSERGVSKFMQKISTGYTMFFNKKYDRSGSLFQGTFKSIHVETNEYLLYLSAYVNKNHFIHGYLEAKPPSIAGEWKYCSAWDYLGKRKGALCNKSIILDQFKDGEYEDFLNKNAEHLKEKKELQKYLLEE